MKNQSSSSTSEVAAAVVVDDFKPPPLKPVVSDAIIVKKEEKVVEEEDEDEDPLDAYMKELSKKTSGGNKIEPDLAKKSLVVVKEEPGESNKMIKKKVVMISGFK